MQDEKEFGVAQDYPSLIRLLRARVDELGLSRLSLDQATGLADGYCSKLLALTYRKHFGEHSLGPVLKALGVKLIVAEDAESRDRVRKIIELYPQKDSRRDRGEKAKAGAGSMDHPRYRVISDVAYVHGAPCRRGQEIVCVGWPTAELEPINDAAHRITSYYSARRHSAFLPHTPFDNDHGRFFLPAVLPSAWENGRLAPVPNDTSRNMPRYRLDTSRQFGKVKYDRGDVVCYLGWPTGLTENAANSAAKRVSEYFEKHRTNQRLLSAPWCEFEQAIFLPALPAPRMIRELAPMRSAKAEFFS